MRLNIMLYIRRLSRYDLLSDERQDTGCMLSGGHCSFCAVRP